MPQQNKSFKLYTPTKTIIFFRGTPLETRIHSDISDATSSPEAALQVSVVASTVPVKFRIKKKTSVNDHRRAGCLGGKILANESARDIRVHLQGLELGYGLA